MSGRKRSTALARSQTLDVERSYSLERKWWWFGRHELVRWDGEVGETVSKFWLRSRGVSRARVLNGRLAERSIVPKKRGEEH